MSPNFCPVGWIPVLFSFLKNQTQVEKKRVRAEFAKLRGILDSEEKKELQKLEEEEEDVLHSLVEYEKELIQQSQLVKELISDFEHRLEGSTIELLQHIRVWWEHDTAL